MIGIPLRDVVAFLRSRGALSVLDGAPFFSDGPKTPPKQPVRAEKLETWDGETVRLLGDEHHAMLYLGDSEICPAAEGWAARVIGIANGYGIARFLSGEMAPRADTLVLCGVHGDICYRWYPQETEPNRWRDGNDTMGVEMPGQAPTSPAERLGVVLRYELGCAP